jgi:tetratricopeptide (TPR) repeat protein
MIFQSLNDGFTQDLLEASEQLLAIDPNPERGHVVRGIVLMKNGDLDGAEEVLQRYVQKYGPTGSVLTNLAKVYSGRGEQDKAETTLWEGLALDPNQDNGLLWWAAIHRERGGKEAFLDAMQKAAAIDGSWRPQLWLARECLENKDLATAKRYYDYILKTAAEQPDVLMMVSGDLGKQGHIREVLDTVLPFYDPERHDIRAGINFLQAYLETKDFTGGGKLLHRLFALNRLDLKDHLMFYSTEFDKLKDSGPKLASEADLPMAATAFRFDRPIWGYGLEDPMWLFPPKRNDGKSIAILALANTSPTDLEVPAAQREDFLGRLTRSIPLYLLESFYYWTDIKPTVVLPVAMGKGPLVFGKEWSVEFIRGYAEGLSDTALTGSLEQVGENVTLRLSVWNCRTGMPVKTFERSSTPQTMGTTVLQFEKELLDHFIGSWVGSTTRFYVRPAAGVLDRYLLCLGQSLSQVLARNSALPVDQMWGERNMYECYLATALELKDAQVPRILFLAALANGKAYGSSVYDEFQRQALALVAAEKDRSSEFYRLSPLLLKVFSMNQEFAQCKAELLKGAEPSYREWIERL